MYYIGSSLKGFQTCLSQKVSKAHQRQSKNRTNLNPTSISKLISGIKKSVQSLYRPKMYSCSGRRIFKLSGNYSFI